MRPEVGAVELERGSGRTKEGAGRQLRRVHNAVDLIAGTGLTRVIQKAVPQRPPQMVGQLAADLDADLRDDSEAITLELTNVGSLGQQTASVRLRYPSRR